MTLVIPADDHLKEIIRAIPRPGPDVQVLRDSLVRLISREWSAHVPTAVAGSSLAKSPAQTAKARFIANMYARACYSMLLVSSSGPIPIRVSVRALSSMVHNRRALIWLNCRAIQMLRYVIPQATHRRIVIMSALMGAIDGVLDEVAPSGYPAALRIASMLSDQPEGAIDPIETTLQKLAKSVRQSEDNWRAEYWRAVILPAVKEYCCAEVAAVSGAIDVTGLSFRWAGIDAAIKGMWYAIGPSGGVTSANAKLPISSWNAEQKWMADTSLLMQMIDDWSDQDSDRGYRQTPVLAGAWTPDSIGALYLSTVSGLEAILDHASIENHCLRSVIIDLYRDYIHAAIEAVASGVAA